MRNLSLWTCFAVAGFPILLLCISSARGAGNPPDNVSEIELVGSCWCLIYDNPRFGHREYNLIFDKDDKLINHHPDEKTPDDDTREARGREVVFRINNNYAVYGGELSDLSHMSGTATSEVGRTWEWKAHNLKSRI